MKFDISNTKIFLKPGTIDFRTSLDSQLYLIKNFLKEDPFSGAVFLFCNKTKTTIKAIWWANSGFWVCSRKQEGNRKWHWPKNKEEAQKMSQKQIEGFLVENEFSLMKIKLSYDSF